MEHSPAFQFYPGDFLSDPNVAGMSLQERGAYITLICLCWKDGSLPVEEDRLARMVGVPLSQWRRLAPMVVGCFVAKDDRLTHKRLDRERDKQEHFRRRQSDKGKVSSEKRWGAKTGATPLSDGNRGYFPVTTETQPDDNHGVTKDAVTAVEPRPVEPESNSSIFNLQTSVISTPLTPLTGGRATRNDRPEPDGFEGFWHAYPRKIGKDAAQKAYAKRKPDAELHQRMLSALERQRRDPQWVRDGGQFIPHPATWLNQGRWQDETSGPVPVGSSRRWTPDDCQHQPHCGNATNCANRAVIEQARASV